MQRQRDCQESQRQKTRERSLPNRMDCNYSVFIRNQKKKMIICFVRGKENDTLFLPHKRNTIDPRHSDDTLFLFHSFHLSSSVSFTALFCYDNFWKKSKKNSLFHSPTLLIQFNWVIQRETHLANETKFALGQSRK